MRTQSPDRFTTFERMSRMFEHKDADRVPFIDSPWRATVERWVREGMPEGMDWREYFGVDITAGVGGDTSPRYEEKTIEETEEHRIFTTRWGATMKDFKHSATVPEFLDFTVTTPDKWREAKSRMTPTRDRVNWEDLRKNYKTWREKGYWVSAGLWFGFDVAHSWMVGTERFLEWMVLEPELCVDIFSTYLDASLTLAQMIWDEGYRFDAINWPDDMGYKHKQFFSLGMYRELLKPFHKRAVDWAHAKGIKACLHSCGDVNPLIPELIEIGIDSLNPIEVKAGMDPVGIKRQFGDKLVLHGGINALHMGDRELIRSDIESVVPEMKKNGGYVFSTDHSIPSDVGLQDFKEIVALLKKVGSY